MDRTCRSRIFNVILGVDHNAHAAETHAANFGGASVVADLSNEADVERIISDPKQSKSVRERVQF